MLLYAALAFTFLNLTGRYPPELRSTVLDTDWTYRRLLPGWIGGLTRAGQQLWRPLREAGQTWTSRALGGVSFLTGPRGTFARTWSIGDVAVVVALMLAGYLVLLLWLGSS